MLLAPGGYLAMLDKEEVPEPPSCPYDREHETSCSKCFQVIPRRMAFACIDCETWPLCSSCNFNDHFMHKNQSIDVVFKSRVELFDHWWKCLGSRQYTTVKKLDDRAEGAVMEYDAYARHSPCLDDPHFLQVAAAQKTAVIKLSEAYHMAIAITSNFRGLRNLMDDYRRSIPMCGGAPMNKLAISPDVDTWIDRIAIAINGLAMNVERREELETAVIEMERLNHLLYRSIPSGQLLLAVDMDNDDEMEEEGAMLEPVRFKSVGRGRSPPSERQFDDPDRPFVWLRR